VQGRCKGGELALYDELLEAWSREKENAEIQPLPRGFYARLAEYVKKLREEKRMLDEKTIRGRLLVKEEENVRAMVEELILTRYEKMMRTVTKGLIVPTSALTEEEDNLYREATAQVDSLQDFIRSLLLGRQPKERRTRSQEAIVIRILQEIPEIIGADLKTYGPFKPEDIATLPRENARTLIKQGAAAEIETG